jgi:hypothetical protein
MARRTACALGVLDAVVVEAVVVEIVMELVVPSVVLGPAAAAAAATPANASKSPQARMERRNLLYLPRSIASRRPNGREIRSRRAPLGAAYAIGGGEGSDKRHVMCVLRQRL